MCTSCFIDYCLRELFSKSCNTEIFRDPSHPQHSLPDLDPADPPVLDFASSFPAWCIEEESDRRTRLQSTLPAWHTVEFGSALFFLPPLVSSSSWTSQGKKQKNRKTKCDKRIGGTEKSVMEGLKCIVEKFRILFNS